MIQRPNDTFSGPFLKEQRKRHHLTQAALGKKVGLVGETIRAYESGKRVIQQTWIVPIATALEMTPEDAREWERLVRRDAEIRHLARRHRQPHGTLALR